jgi:wobble nucleotide-excising tRNase
MLLKLNRIKNLGVFSDYSWDAQLPPFERFNVIYGDNGSGKTTLSRLLDCLKVGKHDEYPTLEFKIDSQSGDLVHGAAAARRVRVFNADYVQLNIGQLDGSLKPILVIGEENKSVAEKIIAEESELTSRREAIKSNQERVAELEVARGKVFTEIAKTIGEAISGKAPRNYRKNNAEKAFRGITDFQTLPPKILQAHRNTIHQEVMDKLDTSIDMTVEIEGQTLSLVEASKLLNENVASLCERSAISDAIMRLQENSEISKWVEAGNALHKKIGSKDCEFCGQPVPVERWKQLENHFSTADQALKDDIEHWIINVGLLMKAFSSTGLPDRMALYSDFRDQYDHAKSEMASASQLALKELETLIGTLTTKLSSRASAMPFKGSLDFAPLKAAMVAAVSVIEQHNNKTGSFDDAVKQAEDEIVLHYLTSVRISVVEFDDKIEGLKQLIEKFENASPDTGTLSIEELGASISEKKAQLSNAHKAALDLTQRLHTFLGRSELTFASEEDGYRIYRAGKVARRLSEGERTAIAFIYFIVQLTDQEFDLAEGIIVIDDPVSSLDAGSVYQAFAFLKNAVKDAKQVFLLTHNFAFLRLVINWFENIKKAEGKKQFYMLLCKTNAAGRQSSILTLDRALIDHPTEYHFLFKTLATFQGNGTIASCYHIPNVTRKVLETFLDFYVPERKALYAKLADIKFDEDKKTAIYKFANDLSHFTGQGFEPGLVQESQKNSAYLLEMIKALAPQHYEGMMASI